MIFVEHTETIVFAPTPRDLSNYLDTSDLWEEYTHPKNPNLNGWKFFQKDHLGKDIIMPGYTIWERTAERFESICKIESAFTGSKVEDTKAFQLAKVKKGE